MAVELQGPQFAAYQDALMGAFPNYDSLRNMLRRSTGLRLAQISPPAPLPEVVGNLLDWAEAQERLDELIAGALSQAPRSSRLRALSLEVCLTSPGSPSAELESIVLPHVPMVDVASWRGKMEQLEGLVCRIDLPSGDAVGTGFLIGPDLIMTNCHVVEAMNRGGSAVSDSIARFDFSKGEDGSVASDERVGFAGAGVLASSAVADLDYAVIRLSKAVDRRHLPPPQPHEFSDGEVHLILHHPRGVELKLSAGILSGQSVSPRRVNYTANTRDGSSGSPVFTLGWKPVALHHAGGRTANMGIPLQDIARHLAATGLWT